jgi:hypothetical protein
MEFQWTLQKKHTHTHTFLLPLPQTKMDINDFMGKWCWVIHTFNIYYDLTNRLWNHINKLNFLFLFDSWFEKKLRKNKMQ